MKVTGPPSPESFSASSVCLAAETDSLFFYSVTGLYLIYPAKDKTMAAAEQLLSQ